MSKIEQIPWNKPRKKHRSSTVVPVITITSKAFKSGKTMKTAPYWRFAANRAFMDKYYPDNPKIKRMSVYTGGNGVLFDPRPTKTQTAYLFRIGDYFNDEDLVNDILRHFEIPLKANPNPTSIHIHGKPYKKYDEKMVYEFVYINDENPDTTQLAGLKAKLEADERFPEADEPEKSKTIKVED